MKHYFLAVIIHIPAIFLAQTVTDSIKAKNLDGVVVKSYRIAQVSSQLQDVHGTYLVGGRKSEVLSIQELSANLTEKKGRQIFAIIDIYGYPPSHYSMPLESIRNIEIIRGTRINNTLQNDPSFIPDPESGARMEEAS